MIRVTRSLLALAAPSLLLWSPLLGCPQCVKGSPYVGGLWNAFYFLLPLPFLLAGAVGYMVYRIGKNGPPPQPRA